ncbi:MAG: transposase, partial [Holophagales bacterium]|nr:transposase [Holophagales bacterium]
MRADSGFARDALMDWCEQNAAGFVLGLARNTRLQSLLEPSFEALEAELEGADARAGRSYADLRYRTLKSWSRERRVIGKAESTGGGRNPRFVVTSIDPEQMAASGSVAPQRRRSAARSALGRVDDRRGGYRLSVAVACPFGSGASVRL